MEKRELTLKKEIDNLKVKNIDVERHNRKYNLLFYGIPESVNEDAEKTARSFLKNDVKIAEEQVDQMIIANVHRLPTRGTGPNPIIVRFVRWPDRELVMNQVYKGALPKEKNILTDLPPVLKEQRYKLMKDAYTLRASTEKYRTRILEKGNTLKLQIRKDVSQPWADHKA